MTNPINTKDYQLLMEWLQSARKKSGMTQRAVAKKLSRPQSYVSKIERGERRIDPIDRSRRNNELMKTGRYR